VALAAMVVKVVKEVQVATLNKSLLWCIPTTIFSTIAMADTWDGLYVGGSLDFAAGANNKIGSTRSFPNTNEPSTSGGATGGHGGDGGTIDASSDIKDMASSVYVGYNWQAGHLVSGIEGDLSAYGSIDNILGSLRGRLGTDVNKVLFYGTAGISYFAIDDSNSAIFAGGAGGNGGAGGQGVIAGNGGVGGVGTPNKIITRNNVSEFGLVAGLGAEYGIAPQTTLGVEALYYSFDNLDKAGFDDDFFMLRARLSMGLEDNFGGIARSDKGTTNWAGLYLGGHGGMLFDTADTIDETRVIHGGNGGNGANGANNDGGGGGGGGGAGGTALALLDSDDVSLFGGIQLGYNWQQGRMVYGVETDGSFGSHRRDYLASLRGRLGWTYSSHLLYLTGGVAVTKVDHIIGILGSDGGNGSNGGNSVNAGGNGIGGNGGFGGNAYAVSNTEHLIGYAIGAGIDTKLMSNTSFGVEAMYYGFNGDSYNYSDLGISGTGSAFISTDDDRSAFVIRAKLASFF